MTNDWDPWVRKFLWWPEKINGRCHWLCFVYERKRINLWYSQKYEYQYAFTIFEMIKKTK
jgi:hypothetical protein